MTMPLPPDMIERITSAMRAKRAELQHAPLDRIYGELFEAAFSALGDTHVMVPREPTEAMIHKGAVAIEGSDHGHNMGVACDDAERAYRAMISAATASQE